MMRRAFTTSTRALRSNSPLLRQPFLQTSPIFSSRAIQPAASRWYSDAKESPAEGAKSEQAEAKQNGESDAVAELKKALEAKDAEARDWKVRTRPSARAANAHELPNGPIRFS